tara:strand:- start:1679 stop:2089 length:411 start_codon:yes stop_codon:yes gene_type:complete
MHRRMNKKECFAAFGIRQHHERMSWAGISDSKDLVVLTIWNHEKTWDKERKIIITSNFERNNHLWINKPGNLERINIIQHCIKELSSRFRAIYAEALDKDSDDLSWKYGTPIKDRWFKIKDFDDKTGEFSSEQLIS